MAFNKDYLILIGGSASATRQYLYLNKAGDDVTSSYFFTERDLNLGDQITVVSGTSNINRATYAVTEINNLDATVTISNSLNNASTATLASSATKLATARTIFGTAFDGTANITSVSGKIETTNTSADSIKTAGGISVAGAITGATATNTINGLIINSGALSGVTTLTASGKIETTNTGGDSIKSAGGANIAKKLQVDDTSADSIKTAGGINWAGGNVIYVPIGASIQDAIGGATTGDTIILGAGTYTITSTITVNKKLHITGQGKGITTVTSATNQTSMFVITTESDSLISNMTIETTAIDITPSERCILFEIDGTVQDVMFKLSGSGSNVFGQAVRNGTSGVVANLINCDMVATGEYESGNHLVTCESGGIVNIYNCYAYSSNSTNERIIGCYGGTVNIYNSFFEAVVTSGSTSSPGVVHCDGLLGLITLYNTTIKATGEGTVELKRVGGTLTVYNCTLGNNTTSGTITYKGTQRVNSLQSSGTIKVGAYTLPATDGTNGQVLKTNGSGVLTWSDI